MTTNKFNRDCLLIALGGRITSDMVGIDVSGASYRRYSRHFEHMLAVRDAGLAHVEIIAGFDSAFWAQIRPVLAGHHFGTYWVACLPWPL